MKSRLFAVFAAVVTTRAVGALQLLGTVRDTVTARPIADAVVVIQDSAGQTVGRAVSDQHVDALHALSADVNVFAVAIEPRS